MLATKGLESIEHGVKTTFSGNEFLLIFSVNGHQEC